MLDNQINSSLLSGFKLLVNELGGDSDALLKSFGLPLDIETQKDDYVPFKRVAMLFEHSATQLNCPDFGLRLARLQGIAVLGPVAVLVRNATNIEEAIRSVTQYLHLVSPSMSISLRFYPERDNVRAEFHVNEAGLINLRQVYELYIGNAQLILQMLVGKEVFAERIYLPHNRVSPDVVYQNFFHCPVEFDQEICAADLPISVLNLNVRGADPETARIASSYLVDRFGTGTATLKDQVEHLIGQLLPTGYCRISVVAEQLNLHPRTLQRRLSAQNQTTFDDLVDQQRQTRAQRYLEDSDLHLAQIAGLLGYADQSAFNRSCKRWFKLTPRNIRQGRLASN